MKRILLALSTVLLWFACATFSQPERPKIYGIAFVRFKSVDMQKSRDFYSKILGLASGSDGCRGATKTCFVVDPFQYIELSQTASRDSGSFLDQVGYTVSDLPEMRSYLSAHGLYPGPISRLPNGLRSFDLEDPEHNRIAFVESSGTDSEIEHLGQVGRRLLHAGWVVKDLDTERAFYSSLLGFRLYWYGGFKDADTDWYEIQVPDGSNWVEFMLNIPASADHQELGVQNHFALGVTDIKAAAAKLRANGLVTTDQPEIGRDGKWSFDIYDPDGNRVEFMEFKPASDPCCHPYSSPHPQL